MTPQPTQEEQARFTTLANEFEEFLRHNEHELALDMLEELGDLVSPRGGFWKD